MSREFLTVERLRKALSKEPRLAREKLDEQGATLLMLLANKNHLEGLDIVLPLSDIAAVNRKKKTALIWAIETVGVSTECIERLSAAGGLEQCDPYGNNPLMTAARLGRASMIPFLLNERTAQAKNDEGYTALAMAAALGRVECIKLLIPHSDVGSALTDSKKTPLMLAAGWNHEASVMALLPHSDAQAVDKNGWCALETAYDCAKESGWQSSAPLLDALAVKSKREVALDVRQRLPKGALPQFEALLEHEILQNLLANQSHTQPETIVSPAVGEVGRDSPPNIVSSRLGRLRL